MSSAAAAAFVPFLVDAVGDVEVTTVNAACGGGGGDRATSSSFITSVGASDLSHLEAQKQRQDELSQTSPGIAIYRYKNSACKFAANSGSHRSPFDRSFSLL